MSFADRSTYFDCGDGSIIGCFREKDTDNVFEFSENQDVNEAWAREFPHKIWVTEPRPGIDQGFRYGTVKKTVAYLAVSEDEYGMPILEKWYIKGHRIYPEPKIVYQLFDHETHQLIREEPNRGDAEQARGILEEAVGRRLYICEHRLDYA